MNKSAYELGFDCGYKQAAVPQSLLREKAKDYAAIPQSLLREKAKKYKGALDLPKRKKKNPDCINDSDTSVTA